MQEVNPDKVLGYVMVNIVKADANLLILGAADNGVDENVFYVETRKLLEDALKVYKAYSASLPRLETKGQIGIKVESEISEILARLEKYCCRKVDAK